MKKTYLREAAEEKEGGNSVGDGGRRPLYRDGCRCPSWRKDPTVVAHGNRRSNRRGARRQGAAGPAPCTRLLAVTLRPWATAVGRAAVVAMTVDVYF
jgi:hypothetical protein